jgi:hypothetical protein
MPNRFEPYSEYSRPVWLDAMNAFLGRAYPYNVGDDPTPNESDRSTYNNANGYGTGDKAAVPAATTLASETALGNAVFAVQTGLGAAYDLAKLPVVIGDDLYDWQANVVASVSSDNVTCSIPARKAWAAASRFSPLWTNASHLTTAGYKFFASMVANAKLEACDLSSLNLLGAFGDMGGSPAANDGTYTDTNAIALVPTGWVSVGHGDIKDATLARVSWAPSSAYPTSRIGAGRGCRIVTDATVAAGCGVQLATAIPVVPGEEYCLHMLVRASTGRVTLQAYDATNSAVIAETGGNTIGSAGEESTLRVVRYVLRFTVPLPTRTGANLETAVAGCSSLQIRLVTSTSHTSEITIDFDDVWLTKTRQATNLDLYAVPDCWPAPVVLFGDSWGAPCYSHFLAALRARLPYVTVIDRSVTGYKLYQLNAIFDTVVAPLAPGAVIHMSGFQNDLSSTRTQTQKEGDIDEYIANCRAIGARPIFAGCTPYAPDGSVATGSAFQDAFFRARLAVHSR